MLYLLNGPPRSGKDTVAGIIGDVLGRENVAHFKLSHELKLRTHAMYGLRTIGGEPLGAERFEESKDKPEEGFRGLAPRQAYIEAHERYWKPVHGPRILGEWLAEEIQRSPFGNAENLVVSDAGDRDQCLPLLDLCGAENTILIKLRRPGCEWDNRQDFDLPEALVTWTVYNDGTLKALRALFGRWLA